MHLKKFEQYLEGLTKNINPQKEPGFCSAIINNGEVVHTINHGLASIEHGASLTSDSLFYLASVSKQFTAACVLKLVHDKKLKLTEDVRGIVKETKHFPRKITIQNLLNHTSGIADYFEYIELQLGRHQSDYFDNKHLLELIGKFEGLCFRPNAQFSYSNSNYIVLSEVVKVRSKLTLAKFAKKHLFNPLDMNKTVFDDDRFKIIKNRVTGYIPQSKGRDKYRLDLKNSCTVGDGGVLSSINDLIKWELNFYKNRALDASVIRGLTKSKPLKNKSGNKIYYANGLELSKPSEKVKFNYHGGGFYGFSTFLIRAPSKKSSLIFLSNNESLSFNPK